MYREVCIRSYVDIVPSEDIVYNYKDLALINIARKGDNYHLRFYDRVTNDNITKKYQGYLGKYYSKGDFISVPVSKFNLSEHLKD